MSIKYRFSQNARTRLTEARPCEVGTASWQLSYQSCRFCKAGLGEVKRLWKYGTRVYACDRCRDEAMAEHRRDMAALQEAIKVRFAQGR